MATISSGSLQVTVDRHSRLVVGLPPEECLCNLMPFPMSAYGSSDIRKVP